MAAGRQASPAAVTIRLDAHRSLGAPRQFRNLALIPVYDSSARQADTYMTLDEGLKTKVVTVKESPSGGEVNTLYVTNGGRKPLYLMAGEVVLGGQQDRCLGRDTIIPPDKRDQPVTVFCVEHGRWTGHKQFDESAMTVASADIRASAQEGAFAAARSAAVGSVRADAAQSVDVAESVPGVQASTGRVARQQATAQRTRMMGGYARLSEEQQKVWDKVAAKNARFKAQPSTGTYRGVLNLADGEAQKIVAPYVKALAQSLRPDPHLVGVVAAVNGKVVTADIFGNPTLFHKLWPKLLRSYAADAAENAPSAKQTTPTVTIAQAKAFLIGAADAKSKAENRSDVSTTLRLESRTSLTYRLVPAASAGGGFGGGAANGSLHESVLRK
jgi:hypothetical protein